MTQDHIKSKVDELIKTANQSNHERTSDINFDINKQSSKSIAKEYVMTSAIVIFFYLSFGTIMYVIKEPVEQAAIETNDDKR